MPLTQALKNRRIQNPAKAAIAFGEQSCNYRDFDGLTDNIAASLLAAGAEPGDRVALHLLNGPELALSYIGCLKAGCVVVPVNTRLKGYEIDYILRHSGSAWYIGQPELYTAIIEYCPALAALDQRYITGGTSNCVFHAFSDLLRMPNRSFNLSAVSPEQTAAILYTSGTTAQPKGVMHSHRTLMETANAMRDICLDENQVVLIMSSMMHMIGFAMLFLPALVHGATAVITRPYEFRSSLRACERWGCTYMLGLPAMFHKLLESQIANPHNMSSGRFYFCGGDSVSAALQQTFQSRLGPICEVYGSTEIAPATWCRPGDERVGSIGKPGKNTAFRLMQPNGSEAEPGAVGELWIRGPHLMTGYWQDAESTASALHDGWFRTGDLARRDADGFYWFAGRQKEIIVRGGSNISPQEVEAVLYQHPAVAEVGVVGRPHLLWGETVTAHVVLRPGCELKQADLIAFARQRLADYKTPEEVIFQSELPKGLSGKIQRRALREAAYAHMEV